MYTLIKLILPVQTGKIPFEVSPFEIAINYHQLEFWKKRNAFDILMCEDYKTVGEMAERLKDCVMHMAAYPQDYLLANEFFDDPTDMERMAFHQAIYFLAQLALACEKYPLARIKIKATGGPLNE